MAKVALTPYVNGLPLRWTEAKTADYTVTKYDSGTIFHTTGATAAVTFTLPKISDGPFYFLFINGADVDMTVTAGTADTAITYNDLAADSVAFSTSSEKIGGAVEVICDGTSLFVLPRAADGRYQTATIATA
jgi:hypothetical protein